MSLMRASGWVMLVLGPVALAGSFAVGAPGAGLAAGPALLLAGAINVYLGKGELTPLADVADLYRFGRPANAEVISVEDTALSADGTRTAKLAVRVSPVNESKFKSTRTVTLPAGRIPIVGSTVTVKFDPKKRRNFVLLEKNVEVKDHVNATADGLFGALKA